jgi:hypothetical protein
MRERKRKREDEEQKRFFEKCQSKIEKDFSSFGGNKFTIKISSKSVHV